MSVISEGVHNVAPKKGNRRVYLEGLDFSRLGFHKGCFIKVDTSKHGLLKIEVSQDKQKHSVSGRPSCVEGVIKPIIDLNFSALTECLGLEGELISEVAWEFIEIRVHHEKLAQLERESRCKNEVLAGELSVGSVCTGIGVSVAAGHQALTDVGIKGDLRFVCDIEQKYLDVFHENNPAMSPLTKVYKSSIESLRESSLPLVSKLSLSLPCTNYSSAGKSAKKIKYAEEDKGATALFGLMRIIKACNPAIIESENVVSAKDSLSYMLLKWELSRMGYRVFEIILDDTNGGCLEARKRYYLVALSSGIADGFLIEGVEAEERIHNSVADVLECGNVLSDVRWWENNHFDRELADKKSKNLNFSTNFIETDAEKVNVIRRQYTKHQISSPYFSDGGRHRLFVPKEIARLQRVPEALISGVSKQVATEGLGQGVSYFHPYNLTRHYMRFLMNMFKGVVEKLEPKSIAVSVEEAIDSIVDAGNTGSDQYQLCLL